VVTLITGPVGISSVNNSIRRINVTSADEMFDACMKYSPNAEIIVMAAAVADYKPSSAADHKLKKSGDPLEISLIPTRDILSELGSRKNANQILVGFALETHQEEENARKKLMKKNLDMIVMNSLKNHGAGFKSPTNKISVLFKTGDFQHFPLKPKQEVAKDIIDCIESII